MTGWRWLAAGVLMLAISACAAPRPAVVPEPGAVPQGPGQPMPAPISGSEELTGAEFNAAPPARITYPAGSLYRPGALLPTDAGLEHLQRLASWLAVRPTESVLLRVGATAGDKDPTGEQLAAARIRLLQQFFRRQGLLIDGWSWRPVADPEYQLELEGFSPVTGQ